MHHEVRGLVEGGVTAVKRVFYEVSIHVVVKQVVAVILGVVEVVVVGERFTPMQEIVLVLNALIFNI